MSNIEDIAKELALRAEYYLQNSTDPELDRGKLEHFIALELKKFEEPLLFLRNEYTEFGGRACPACEYDNGRFIKRCKLHYQIDKLKCKLDVANYNQVLNKSEES